MKHEATDQEIPEQKFTVIPSPDDPYWQIIIDCAAEFFIPAFEAASKKHLTDTALFGALMAAYANCKMIGGFPPDLYKRPFMEAAWQMALAYDHITRPSAKN